jgi:hypothetical protein
MRRKTAKQTQIFKNIELNTANPGWRAIRNADFPNLLYRRISFCLPPAVSRGTRPAPGADWKSARPARGVRRSLDIFNGTQSRT